jgi:hypothetical protein
MAPSGWHGNPPNRQGPSRGALGRSRPSWTERKRPLAEINELKAVGLEIDD